MKVLFAVNSESVSDAIIKKYQKDYREIISYKNVYYFNAIQKEIQQDKSYDRIIISEDLEPFSNNNYEAIDKIIFERLDGISDEAHDTMGNEISIILICSERHTKGSSFLVKLFGIGVYNALLGNDRSFEEICRLINKPRTKKEAKMYYRIDTDDVNYRAENENEVSELEIQNIIAHFKKLGKNTQKYADSFKNIADQYTDEQLKIIINCLPMNVKANLEETSPKYQEIMAVDGGIVRGIKSTNAATKEAQRRTGLKIDIIENKMNQTKMTQPIVIPNSVKATGSAKAKKVIAVPVESKKINITENKTEAPQTKKINQTKKMETVKKSETVEPQRKVIEKLVRLPDGRVVKKKMIQKDHTAVKNKNTSNVELTENKIVKPVRKSGDINEKENKVNELPDLETTVMINKNTSKVNTIQENIDDDNNKRKRGRPRKTPLQIEKTPKGKRGRPRKVIKDEFDNDLESEFLDEDDELIASNVATENEINSPNEEFDVPELDDELTEEVVEEAFDEFDEYDEYGKYETTNRKTNNVEELYNEDIVDESEDLISALDEDDESEDLISALDEDDESEDLISALDEDDKNDNLFDNDSLNYKDENVDNYLNSIEPTVDYSMSNLNSLMTKDKKIVTFLGSPKNGVSFLVNNLAELFASARIDTAILDMTRNKNSYYIYTQNEESLRKIAYTSIDKLQNGIAEGIKVKNNLTVYTSLPTNENDYPNAEPILSTLVQNHSLVLIDCDFETNPSYFANCQEIYLVQSMDILTIQPLTAFLRELKTQGVLEPEKVKVVINKELKVRGLTNKAIIGGLSMYNDPAMAFMTELFNKDIVKYCRIPFEPTIYSKYLEAILNCKISINGYSKNFMTQLKNLGGMVYPLIGSQSYSNNNKAQQNYSQNSFSNSMNDTLGKMKKKY